MLFKEITAQMISMIATHPEADKLSQMLENYAEERPGDYRSFRNISVFGAFLQEVEEAVDARITQ
jgi:hypothetical protein